MAEKDLKLWVLNYRQLMSVIQEVGPALRELGVDTKELVLLAELDNPTGDTTWDLPLTASTDGTSVFWAGSGKLVVGKTQLRPVFSAAFTKESLGR